jgi:hypothetical protein
MQKTISEIITLVNAIKDNAYPESVKIAWINEVDGGLWNDVFQYKVPYDIMRIKGTVTYDLPAGVDFSLVEKVFADGVELQQISLSNLNTTGYYRDTTGRLGIYPIPDTDDTTAGLHVVYASPYVPKTLVGETVYAPAPFDKMYTQYIIALIDWYNKEYEGYNNGMIQFNTSYQEYLVWYRRLNNVTAAASSQQ